MVQFNILADGLSGKRPDHGGFADLDPACLEWKTRCGRIIQEIISASPHVICLEEVDRPKDFIQHPSFEHFDSVFKSKPHSPAIEFGGSADGCLILFDRRRLKRVKPQPDESFALGPMDNQVAACVVVEDLLFPGDMYVICGAHLKATKSEAGEEVRTRQVDVITDQLNFLCQKYGAVASILCSDLNGVPSGTAYKRCTDEKMESCMYELMGGTEPKMTTCKKRGTSVVEHTIDYIFYDSIKIKPSRFLEIPVDLGCMPSWKYPSDHVMLCVGFVRE